MILSALNVVLLIYEDLKYIFVVGAKSQTQAVEFTKDYIPKIEDYKIGFGKEEEIPFEKPEFSYYKIYPPLPPVSLSEPLSKIHCN